MVCRNPSANVFCADLDRIRADKNEAEQGRFAGRWFAELEPSEP
jgi:hypothetical protein